MAVKNLSTGPVAGRLSGKVALVTGAGGGQGQEVALTFARAGAAVAISDINAAGLDETVSLAARENLKIDTTVVDASNEAAVISWVDSVASRLGGIDVLYNNAAHTHFAPFADMTLEQWRETLRLELDVVFIPSRAAWRHLIDRGGGSIINVASVCGMRGAELIGAAAHAAGKSGVIGFTRQLALEGAPHWIRANSISPGAIVAPVTEVMMAENEQFRRAFESWPLLDRAGRAVDVAYTAVFLASQESAYITGINLAVDGGYSCKGGFKNL